MQAFWHISASTGLTQAKQGSIYEQAVTNFSGASNDVNQLGSLQSVSTLSSMKKTAWGHSMNEPFISMTCRI